jgi:plasmid stabilization system protein ParE
VKRRLILGPVAEEELAEAIRWYEGQRKGLGKSLRVAVRETFQAIRASPEARAVVRPPDVRRALVTRFPYAVFFRVVEGNVRVISVFHTSRDPANWQRAADHDTAG